MKNTGKAAIFILCLLTGFFLWGETVRAGEEDRGFSGAL